MTSALGLPKLVREEASALFRQAQSDDLLLGRSIEAIAVGALYGVCRCSSVTRSMEEIARVARCDRDGVKLGYNVLNREVGLGAEPTTPDDLLPKNRVRV